MRRGSKRGDGARFGPMPANRMRTAATSALPSERERDPPVHATERVEEMRRRGAERQRADEDAHHQPHVALRPRRRELHADGIDAAMQRR
jgi:hypothetical protein